MQHTGSSTDDSTYEQTQTVISGPFVLEESGKFVIMKKIDDEICERAIRFILMHNAHHGNKLKNLTIIINSPGGSVYAALALIDVMRGSKIPVHTIGLGLIASAGLLVFMAGAKGNRVITPNTSILSHQYSWGSKGKEHELFASTVEQKYAGQRMLEHYKLCTGLSEKIIKEKLLPPSDVWLSGKEAKKFKLCDHIQDIK